MSRSRRKTPVVGVGGPRTSEKWWKSHTNGALRARIRVLEKQLLKNRELFDNTIFPIVHDVVNTYDGPKDGKMRINPADAQFKRLMRK